MVQFYRRQTLSTSTSQLTIASTSVTTVEPTTSFTSTSSINTISETLVFSPSSSLPSETLTSSSPSQSTTFSPSLLLVTLLGTIGVIIILLGLLIIVFCLRREEKVKRGVELRDENDNLTSTYIEGDTDGCNNMLERPTSRVVDVRRTSMLNENGEVILVDVVTYHASESHDSLPSYAEAVVRGRAE